MFESKFPFKENKVLPYFAAAAIAAAVATATTTLTTTTTTATTTGRNAPRYLLTTTTN